MDNRWSYVIIDPNKIKPELLDKLEKTKEEYLDILDKMWDDGKTEYEHREDLDKFYADVAERFGVNNRDNAEDLENLYMFVHNKVRELKSNLRKRGTFANFASQKSTEEGEETFSAQNKKDAINFKKPYADYKSKKWILKKILPSEILNNAYAKLYPNNNTSSEIERENG